MKRKISLVLTLLLCFGLTSPSLAADVLFKDVPSSHWAFMEAYTDGAVQGTSANTYNPVGNATMAQFIAILTRVFCSDWLETSTADYAWYVPNYEAVAICYSLELIPGIDSTGRFFP